MPTKSMGTLSDYHDKVLFTETVDLCKKVGSYPNYSLDYDTIDYYPYIQTYDDDRKTISYGVGRGRANSCNHVMRVPYKFVVAIPPCNRVPNMNQMNTVYWYEYKNRCSTLSGQLSIQGMNGGGALPTTGLPGCDWNSLVDQVGQQLDGRMLSSQNMLVSISQVMQTVGMFKNPLQLRKLRRLVGTGKPLSKVYRMPANQWLEFQFGWKPLVADIKALYNVWSEVRQHQAFLKSAVDKFTSIASRNQREIVNPNLTGLTAKSVFGGRGTFTLNPKCSRVIARDCFSLDLRRTAAMASWSTMDQVFSRLGCRDVVEALWDLVPFSFVVDWFTHVNRFIEQRSIEWNRFDIRFMCYSSKVEHHVYLEVPYMLINAFGNDYGTVITDPACVQKSYVRASGFPPNSSTVGLFGHLSQTQLADLAALIVQRI